MDCMTISTYRNLERLAIRQCFKQEPTKTEKEHPDKTKELGKTEPTVPVPDTCTVLDYKA